LDFPEYQISTTTGQGIEELRNVLYRALDMIRVYTKMPNKKEPDMDKPYTLRRGGTLFDVAELVHKDLAENLKHARIWGTDIIPGSTIKGDYVLHDRDVVEIHANN
jgi:ribosome-interacting GTPase 1